MISTLQTLASFLFVLGVLIFVHEFGHFIVARLYGVRVLRFSLGFDPKLFKFERGGTEYSVGIIPLGGFVKLAGETVEDQRTGAPDEFLSKSKWIRLQVYLAGPVMNIILAVVLLTIAIYRGAGDPLYLKAAPILGAVEAGSSAEKAGLRAGDRIASVGDTSVSTWREFDEAVSTRAKRSTSLTIMRDGERLELPVTPDSETIYKIGRLGGVLPAPQIATVIDDGPAARAGLRAGDVIVSVDGQHLTTAEVSDLTKRSGGKPLVLAIERGGTIRNVPVTPVEQDGRGWLRITFGEGLPPTLSHAFVQSVERNWNDARMIGTTVRGLFKGSTPVNQLMGPVAIASMSGQAAKGGLAVLFSFMAMISLNLGLINLLPIPVMDGGQIAILGFEGLIRRELSMKIKERILLAGAAVIVLLMVTVIYNDIMRLVR